MEAGETSLKIAHLTQSSFQQKPSSVAFHLSPVWLLLSSWSWGLKHFSCRAQVRYWTALQRLNLKIPTETVKKSDPCIGRKTWRTTMRFLHTWWGPCWHRRPLTWTIKSFSRVQCGAPCTPDSSRSVWTTTPTRGCPCWASHPDTPYPGLGDRPLLGGFLASAKTWELLS